ncbi:MAG TPA: hypothetical protein VJ836_04980 [Candidatus Saccharimonadales bacterium]|nr:hypothetical protein [Candidatus Saccharimonadales bacterium]
MTNVGLHFQKLEEEVGKVKGEVQNIKNSVNRIEQKLDPTIERVNELGLGVSKLKQRTA